MIDFNFVVRLHCLRSHETETAGYGVSAAPGPCLRTIQTGFKQTAKVYKHKVHTPLEIDDDDSTSCDRALAIPCYVFTFNAAKVGIDFELVHTLTMKREVNNVFWDRKLISTDHI